jgi:hypothetical protein
MTNNKAQMPNEAQSSNDKGVVLAFKHPGFVWYLDFDIWNLAYEIAMLRSQ